MLERTGEDRSGRGRQIEWKVRNGGRWRQLQATRTGDPTRPGERAMSTTIRQLGRYEIAAVLARGPMSTVYEGWDRRIARKVAIKTLDIPDGDDAQAQERLARFKRGVQAAGSLHHPNIVPVYDYGETNEVVYTVMEFIEGLTLKALLDQKRRLPISDVLRVMGEVLAGMEYSHAQGVIHRDIKPANILLTRDGLAKITDFGIARIEDSNLTHDGTVMGTPAYMSPEQFLGKPVDQRTDLYSAGVVLFQMLTGERPYEGGLATIMHKVLHTEAPPPSALSALVPPALDEVVACAMAKRPQDRFPTAGAFNAALEAAIDLTIVVPTRKRPPPPPSIGPDPPLVTPLPRSSRSAIRFAAIAAAIVLLFGGGVWYASSQGSREPAARPSPPPVAAAAATSPPADVKSQPPPTPAPERTPVVTPPVVEPPPPSEAAVTPPIPAADLPTAPPPEPIALPQQPIDSTPPAPPPALSATGVPKRKPPVRPAPGPRVAHAPTAAADQLPGLVTKLRQPDDTGPSKSDEGGEPQPKTKPEVADHPAASGGTWGYLTYDKNGKSYLIVEPGQSAPVNSMPWRYPPQTEPSR